jgi:tRNA-dihydrouridine synthase C
MKILLAPMEGVVDPVIRELFTAIGGIDYCVTEFVRVTSTLLPKKVFYKYCPELSNDSKTSTGIPVFVQLLGSDLTCMGENAHKASELGAYGIDLNFGCPAKTVNRHDGGAALLKNPERVFQVVDSVRRSVPAAIPVTVKVRLGYSDKSYIKEIAQAAEGAGGHWLTVHARTKEEAYRPPAHWHFIRDMKNCVKIPVIANGDIWTSEDHKKCTQISECEDTMLGRGLMATPDLALQIKTKRTPRSFPEWENLLLHFMEKSRQYRNEAYAVQRTKQFTKLMARTYPESQELFDLIKREKNDSVIFEKTQAFFLNKKMRSVELMSS